MKDNLWLRIGLLFSLLALLYAPHIAPAQELTVRVRIVGEDEIGGVSLLGQGGNSWDMEQESDEHWYRAVVSPENLNVAMNKFEVVLEDETTGAHIEGLRLQIPLPHKDRERRFYIHLERPEVNLSAIRHLTQLPADNRAYEIYFKSKWIHKKSLTPTNYNLLVASAYLWFRGSFQLATSRRGYDAIPIDSEAVRYISEYLTHVEDGEIENHALWKRAWKDFFGNVEHSTKQVRSELKEAAYTEWNMYQYIRFHTGNRNYVSACTLLRHFTTRLMNLDSDARGYISRTYFGGPKGLSERIRKDNQLLIKRLGGVSTCRAQQNAANAAINMATSRRN